MDQINSANNDEFKQRIIIVHGSAITPGIVNRHWYKWLQYQFEKLGFQAIAPSFPDEHEAKDSIWIPFLRDHLKVKENDILIGHSSGAMAILRLSEQIKIKGLILVSAGTGHESDNVLHKYNWNLIRSNTQWIEQFHSSDDPFTSVDSARQIAKLLKSNYREFHDRNHFLCEQFPDLIDIVQHQYGLS